jgi:hypothetical protein
MWVFSSYIKLAKLDENTDTFNGCYVLGFNSGLLFHMLFQRSFAYGNQQNLLHPETQVGPSSSPQVICSLNLSSKSPCLWALVWPFHPCFIPNFHVSRKMSKNWVWFQWNQASGQDLQADNLMRLDIMKNMSKQWSCRQGKSKTGDEN